MEATHAYDIVDKGTLHHAVYDLDVGWVSLAKCKDLVRICQDGKWL